MPHPNAIQSPKGRLMLVAPNNNDDKSIAILRSHPRTRQYLLFMPEETTTEDARALRELRAQDSTMTIFHIHIANGKGSTDFVGMTGILHIDSANLSCEAGMMIMPQWHKKGIATEAFYMLLQFAFEERKLHRVTFEVSAENQPMQRWLEEVAQARLEAERKDYWRNIDGNYTDVKGYCILEGEWRGRIRDRLLARLLS
ncbi:acyl-CoA N-acyltransferase [Crucibulum laeve]|uniref:Acyl-CoA N-acyltransferase n=1 Tax=Crucibulum laeve TaxID=68775 RepID=A0A5C3MHC6_9AGAR|nr:acyl-CoA N-acyltransferase [Crucibulum laeve]